ncbi:hypothetical protein [Nesterenkonia sp. K-15-9-6]|uniref:hypothetical protein n=1 Tax=Nesterenkonia sp. K-15-9-6 TaxID=3093918 RepID=UPI004044EB2F
MESLKNSPHDAVQSIVAAAQAAADALDSRDEEIAELRKERDEARAQATLIRSAASLALSSIPQVVDPGHSTQSGPNAPEHLSALSTLAIRASATEYNARVDPDRFDEWLSAHDCMVRARVLRSTASAVFDTDMPAEVARWLEARADQWSEMGSS